MAPPPLPFRLKSDYSMVMVFFKILFLCFVVFSESGPIDSITSKESGRTDVPRSKTSKESGRMDVPRSITSKESGRTDVPRSKTSKESGRMDDPRSKTSKESGRMDDPRSKTSESPLGINNVKETSPSQSKDPALQVKKKEDAVSLYNQGIVAFNRGERERAELFFEKSFYSYIYFPAYKALKFLKAPVTLIPLIWHIALGIYGLISLILVFLLIVKKLSFEIKMKTFIVWSFPIIFFFVSHVFLLKPKGRVLKDFELKNAPLEGAFSVGSEEKGESFQVLKIKEGWVKIKTDKKQKGWTLKENLYFTRE